MKYAKAVFKRASFLMLVIVMLIALSITIYYGMIEMSMVDCHNQLELATKNMSESVSIRFTDHMNLLDYVADAVALRADKLKSKDTLEYLSSVQESPGTFFDRIDIVFSDGTQLCQQGDYHEFIGIDTFSEMASRGTHISPRLRDDHTGREVIYCGSPIVVDGEIVAILMGMIDCDGLYDEFVSHAYGENTHVLLVDNRDGNYLIDTWHTSLGNINDLGERYLARDTGTIDFAKEFSENKSDIKGFVSKDSGENSYIAYTPVDGFPWMVAIMVSEKVAFQRVYTLRDMLLTAGIIEAILLIIYIIWNIYMAMRVVKNEEKLKAAEIEKTKTEAKNVFLSSISHDIRTPLNGILGMLSVIKSHDDVPNKTRVALDKIEDSAKYLENLTNDVLDLNEIENNKLVLNDDVGSISEFIENLSTLVQTFAENRDVNYFVKLNDIKHDRVHFSRVHLQRVLVNLISNSIKYNSAGGKVELIVDEIVSENGESTYQFTVKDNGIGMSEEFQKQMFNSFEQENAGARTTNTGHGLGLPIVKKLVDKMNGAIEVFSEKGKGTCFKVLLTFKLEKSSDKQEMPDKNVITDLKGIKILLVEDNELNMEIADTLLGAAGAEVVAAVNGKEAVDIFTDSDVGFFDVVLMDVMMPVMNGFEATRKIRSLNRDDARKISIIAMTAKTFADDIKMCLDSGMNEHIAKPIDINSLINKIGQYRGI